MTSPLSLAGAIGFDAYLRSAESGHLAMARRLLEHGLPIAQGWIFYAEADLLEAVRRLGASLGLLRVSAPASDTAALWFRAPEAPVAFVATLGDGQMLLVPVDAERRGKARSTSDQGDADEVRVWNFASKTPWRVERRSSRVSVPGEGLDRNTVEAVADLVDRVQLAEGQPVEIDWGVQEGRPVLLGCVPLRFGVVPGPGPGAWRRVSLTLDDEGTVVPLAIDTLDRALRRGEDGESAAVERVFARPYRRRGQPSVRGRLRRLGGAAAHAARVSAEVAPLLAEVQRHHARFEIDREQLRTDVGALNDKALAAHLGRWQDLAGGPLRLLDRTRVMNRDVLGALESVCGMLPRDVAVSLSMPQFTARRHAVHEELVELARLSEGRSASALDGDARAAWKRARSALSDVRALGIDIRPQAFGASNAGLLRAIARRFEERSGAREQNRRAAAEHANQLAR
ncbi:MAG: hypothetical protein AAF645_25500, partial [Myxococcota bacterium]